MGELINKLYCIVSLSPMLTLSLVGSKKPPGPCSLKMKLDKDSSICWKTSFVSGLAYSSGETPGQAFDKVEPNGTRIESRRQVCLFITARES